MPEQTVLVCPGSGDAAQLLRRRVDDEINFYPNIFGLNIFADSGGWSGRACHGPEPVYCAAGTEY
jgi:hypothetical protein